MTEREPEWSEEDQAWMLALAEHRAGLCPHCGRPLSVCADPDGEGKWVAEPPARCHAYTATLAAQPEYQDSAPQPEALLWRARRKV